MTDASGVLVGPEVADALAAGAPVVALESVIFSGLGLPAPANRQCLERVCNAVRGEGAVPALIGLVDSVPVVGASEEQARRLTGANVKLAARDLGPAIGTGLPVGVTTVSASLVLAAAAGIEVFATGGIGGVHRGAALTGDISQDLTALSRHRLVVVSSGVKAFLDVALTLEYLETLGVAVVGWQTDRFPAFYLRDGGCAVPWTVNNAAQVANAFRAGSGLGAASSLLVANPIPASAELDAAVVDEAIQAALGDTGPRTGPDVTPKVLDHLAETTAGATVEANLALAESNAKVAAKIASALAAG